MNEIKKFRFVVRKQHAGTGFPMGLVYATDDRKEAAAAAKAFANIADEGVYFSIGDTAKLAFQRSRFVYKRDAVAGPLPEVKRVELGRHTPDGAYFWAMLCFANGWEKAVLWPDVSGSPADSSLTAWGKYYDFSEVEFHGRDPNGGC